MKKKDNQLLRWKTRLSRGHMYSVVVTILAITLGFGMYQYKQKLNYKQFLQNQFQEAFYETATYVNNVDNNLAKVRLARKPPQCAPYFAELWKQASSAQENLGRMPYNHSAVSKTLKFLSQVSDYSYAMMHKSVEGKELTDKDWEKLDQIRNYARKLSFELNKVREEVDDGNRIAWGQIEKEGEKALEKAKEGTEGRHIVGSLTEVNKQFQDYPVLLYDGPFSDHIERMEPRMVRGKERITKEQGAEIVKNFLGNDQIQTVRLVGQTDTKQRHIIPVYTYEILLANQKEPTLAIDITQEGGLPIWMLNYTTRPSTDKEISLEDARKKAEDFLARNKYPDMKPSYYEKVDGVAVINFAPEQNNVIMYPDLIKVKVAMDQGEIIGFEARGYIMMHHKRNLPQIKLTEAEARQELSPNFTITKVNKAVIPLESKREVLCYEFKGRHEDSEFIIYINAESGKQEKILQLITTKNAVLTQ